MRARPHLALAVSAIALVLVALALARGGSVLSSADAPAPTLAADIPTADIHLAAANPVAVSPLPGTEDASPSTQISFLGPAGTRVADVHVVGSVSGAHSGRLEAYWTGTGESFLPSHPFVPGERVSVHALVGGGTPSVPASTTFTIAHQASVSQKEFPNNPGDPQAIQRYATLPGVAPSSVRITTPAQSGASPGYLFLAPYQGKGTPGPMIAQQNGTLVWFHSLPAGEAATNFQVQSYEGKPVLTWWQGRILEVGFGQGEDEIYDTAYQPVAHIRAGNGYHADLHEVRLTPQGTAWIDSFDPIEMNLTSVHGASDGVLTDSVVQEIDIKTGLVMWEWHALGHILLSESHNPLPKSSYPWDYIHVNSVDPGNAEDVLLSARNSWTIYDVDLRSGAIRWRLGDRHGSFRRGPGTHFYWQHDAEFQPGGLISVFDNGSTPPEEKQSRGLLLSPDLAAHSVSLVRQLTNPSKTLLASSQGNVLRLSAGNWLLGYGGLPNFTEYDEAGGVLLDGTLGHNVQSFRTYLSPWSGHPASPPAVAVQASAGGALAVSASWNGATEVASWQILGGTSPSTLSPLVSTPESGFQTTVTISSHPTYVAAQALNAAGAVIGLSPAVKP
jgi:hypothetical protein